MKKISQSLVFMVCTFMMFWGGQTLSAANLDNQLIAHGGHHGHHGHHHHGHHGHHGHHHGHHHHHHGWNGHHGWGGGVQGWNNNYWHGGSAQWNGHPGYYYDPNYYYSGTTAPSVQYVPVHQQTTIVPVPATTPVHVVPSGGS